MVDYANIRTLSGAKLLTFHIISKTPRSEYENTDYQRTQYQPAGQTRAGHLRIEEFPRLLRRTQTTISRGGVPLLPVEHRGRDDQQDTRGRIRLRRHHPQRWSLHTHLTGTAGCAAGRHHSSHRGPYLQRAQKGDIPASIFHLVRLHWCDLRFRTRLLPIGGGGATEQGT